MSHPLLAAEAGVRHLLLGNEAIVRGALEAGINVVTCYPGTPSSEIPDTFHYLASCGRYRMEYSVNEKVANGARMRKSPWKLAWAHAPLAAACSRA